MPAIARSAQTMLLVVAGLLGCRSDRPPSGDATPTGSDTHPEWSPDGMSIAFISNREGVRVDRAINFEVYRVGVDGSGEQRLTTNNDFDADIAWSPDGSTLLFKSYQDGNDEVYALDARSGAATNLTNSAASDGGAAWSPDGTTIVFHSDRGDTGSSHLYLMNPDGSDVRSFPTDPGSGHSPRWSPDGRRIAFVSGRDGNAEIYVMDTDGGNVRRLTDDPAEDGYPRWSPDGTRIAYSVGSFDTDRWSVFVMDAGGGNPRRLVDSTDSGNASWSPDGTRLAFGRYRRYGEAGGDDSRLFIVRVDGLSPPSPVLSHR
jgi:Tol biopolymer transport system component